ncbi:rhomboid family intramembrane serine protease [Rhodohalobacter sulfatireducens]|uniref:Rhomboid family intramembrane serine protease n=1 Tax=Rhodohalobacter sulfatireducens TaxID=2911366 RepID=A0ABS9KEV9_9BACT|nr:rhomboid family intramembrane serine protease [Rhodohalobacter sulfatireducens]MCG2589379.1 rhomboid family intramembrane serine protease [Rhodohalobacter sulfatireducens]
MTISVTIILIGITCVISLIALYGNEKIYELGMLRPYRTVRKNSWYEVISSGFLHGSLAHLLVNMFVLFFFGSVMEQVLGVYHFLALYISGLAVSSIPSFLFHRDNPSYATLGASGAVEAVLFSYIFVFPTEKLILLLLPIPIPAWLFGAAFLAYSIYEGQKGSMKINHEAHIAGAIWGILYLLFFVPNSIDHILTILGLL